MWAFNYYLISWVIHICGVIATSSCCGTFPLTCDLRTQLYQYIDFLNYMKHARSRTFCEKLKDSRKGYILLVRVCKVVVSSVIKMGTCHMHEVYNRLYSFFHIEI